jgi:hypothetical protein
LTASISETTNSGSFSNADFARGAPFFFIVGFPQDDTYGTSCEVQISFSGNTCNWSVDPNPLGGRSGTLVFYYGYF